MNVLKPFIETYQEIRLLLKANRGKVAILVVETIVMTTAMLYHAFEGFHSNNPYGRSAEMYNVVYFFEKKDIIHTVTYNALYGKFAGSNLWLEIEGQFNREKLKPENLVKGVTLKWEGEEIARIIFPNNSVTEKSLYVNFKSNGMRIYYREK